MAQAQYELAPRGNRYADIIGKELRSIKIDEPIKTDCLMRVYSRSEVSMERDALAHKAVDAIADAVTGAVKVSCECAGTHARCREPLEFFQIDDTFCIIMERKRLCGKGFTACAAPVT